MHTYTYSFQALTLRDRNLVAIAGSTLQQPADVVVFQKMRTNQVAALGPGCKEDTVHGFTVEDSNSTTSSASPSSDNSIIIGIRIHKDSLRRLSIQRPSIYGCLTFLRTLLILLLAMFGIYALALQYGPPLVSIPAC